MVDISIAAPVRQAGRSITPGGAVARPIVAGLARLGNAAEGAWRNEVENDAADIEAAHRIEMAELERRRAATIADRAGARAELLAGIDQIEAEARQNAKPGATGHGDAVAAEVERRMAEFRGTLGNDPDVIQRFEPLLRGDAARIVGQARAWEIEQFGLYQGDQWKKARDQAMVDLQKNPTLENYARLSAEGELLLDGMALPGNVVERLRTADRRGMANTVLEAQLNGGNSAGVREILAKGLMDADLTADDRERLLRNADLVDQRAALAAERAESEQRDAARKQVKAVEALISAGAEPTPEQMAQVRAAIALLPPDEQIDFAALEIGVAVSRDTRGLDAEAIRSRRDFLAAKVASGKASQQEQMMLRAYDTRLDSAEDAEAEQLKTKLGQGPQGRMALVEQVQGKDSETRFALAEKAEPGLGHVAVLPSPIARRSAIEGRAIRSERKDLVPVKDAAPAFRKYVGAVGNMLGTQYADKMDVAMDMYASWAARTGRDKFDPESFGVFVNIAFGAQRRRDGTWQGGLGTVNGTRVVLPDTLSEAGFRAAIARTDWSDARDARGRPVGKAFITGQMVPLLHRESATHTTYRMVDAQGNVLLDAQRRPLLLKVGKASAR